LNLWAKFYQHKHTAHYWRPGKAHDFLIYPATCTFFWHFQAMTVNAHFREKFVEMDMVVNLEVWEGRCLLIIKILNKQHTTFPRTTITYLADPIDHVAEEKAAAANEELQPSRLRAHVDAQQPHMILLRLTHVY
jgi:hypothetical protein